MSFTAGHHVGRIARHLASAVIRIRRYQVEEISAFVIAMIFSCTRGMRGRQSSQPVNLTRNGPATVAVVRQVAIVVQIAIPIRNRSLCPSDDSRHPKDITMATWRTTATRGRTISVRFTGL